MNNRNELLKKSSISMMGSLLQIECHSAPKPTCQVRNLDTGKLKTMTREAAKLLQAETKDVCNWSALGDASNSRYIEFDFADDVIYTYKRKANLVKLDGELMTREAARAEYLNDDNIRVEDIAEEHYIAGYLRRCQETEQIMKLAKFGAMVLKHDQNEYFCDEEVGNFANNAGLTTRTVLNGISSTSYAPNIEATIKELLND